ncbi:MAG: HAMP domain-containing histidine kinase [Candidatus Sumerlaeia bacterium]|nr:HAMP domain-containing histidine kinase [Candidatus Sumerlaeia bacterium]
MTTPQQADDNVRRMKNQIGWILQLSSALSSKTDIDDIYAILLAGLVAPTGLAYSRVLFFIHDEAQGVLRGHTCLTHESREGMEAIAKELAEEEAFLEERRVSFMETPASADPAQAQEELESLSIGVHWVTIHQRIPPENPITDQLRKLTFSTHPTNSGSGRGSIFEEVALWRGPRLGCKDRLGSRLPPALASLLDDEFVIAPLNTQRGLRGLVFADRSLDSPPRSISRTALRELDWFTSQAALTIDNHEVTTDLSKAYSDLKQLDQLKSNFLSIISHELRTPLTSMSGFVDLILDERVGPINENQRMLLNRVTKNTGHLIHLVNDLIEVAEIEAEGTLEVRLSPIDPLSVLMDTLPKLEQRRRDQKVKVVPEVECDVPTVLSDERALGRIFFHLIDNAIKFSHEKATVSVRFSQHDEELHVEVMDRGVGIAPEDIKFIFQQFYQVDNTLTRGHEGLGLGLAVTKMLIQAIRGRITVDSVVGRGSTFTVILPISS